MMLLLLKKQICWTILQVPLKQHVTVTCLCKIKLGETNDEKLTEELLNMA